MQLFLNTTSPFARLVRVAAIEKGCINQVQLHGCDPWSNAPALLAQHPQARIPVLVTEAGDAIAESLLIAQYLDQLDGPARLVPAEHASAVLARTSVAYGLMEAAFNVVIARKNDGALVADASLMGQRRLAAIDRVLVQLEAAPPATIPHKTGHTTGALTLDQITTVVALAYVQFRLPALLPIGGYPQLCQWLAHAEQRPSLHSTQFV